MADNINRNSHVADIGRSRAKTKRTAITLVEVLIVIAIICVLIALLLPARRTAREAARRNQCQNNLKQIAIALKNYADVHGALPPAYTTDDNGKPLHSWRTLILPFMEEQKLYESIDLTKPWDDPANAAAVNTIVPAYLCPSASGEERFTNYLAVVTPASCFRASEPRNLSDITDGAHETLMVIEVDAEHAVPWMSPVDADEQTVLSLGESQTKSPHPGGAVAAFVDCHVEFLSEEVPAEVRRAMISIAGNDMPTDDDE
jgi:prepilin-type processing-associated H-X9-DG protein